MAAKAPKKGDTMNIQSYIRVRPLGAKEKRSLNLRVGTREITIKSQDSQKSKQFNFDKVFDEDVKQVVVYSSVVKPMIKEVIKGYNCTVFAYGQTGTGKTYTMSGVQENPSVPWEENIHAGIIPRALEEIFSELSGQDFQVSVSFIELYTEKLRNLLDEDNDTNIQLIDVSDGGVKLKGVSPTPVNSRGEAFQLLQLGAERKQVAATLLNLNSSRSHTIFTIYVNVKENICGKEDVLRSGKLYLVDLAGSENVSKSGTLEKIHKSSNGKNKRFAEATNINKSLLTLGRVITSITENAQHIPYRESKLTRILSDSLGGKTKTCIIGTISPGAYNMDETESTLNYASKARLIKNKPEKNQIISKKDFMQDASEEIMKLKRDIEANRQGDGFYISKETHEEMTLRIQQLDSQVKEWNTRYKTLKTKCEQQEELYSSLRDEYDEKCAEHDEEIKIIQSESNRLKEQISNNKKDIMLKDFFIKEYQNTEKTLKDQATNLKEDLQVLLDQNEELHNKIARKTETSYFNAEALNNFKEILNNKLHSLGVKLMDDYKSEDEFLKYISEQSGIILDLVEENKTKVKSQVNDYQLSIRQHVNYLTKDFGRMVDKFLMDMDYQESKMREILLNQANAASDIKEKIADETSKLKSDIDQIYDKSSCINENLRKIMESCSPSAGFVQEQKYLQEIKCDIMSEVDKLAQDLTKLNLHALSTYNTNNAALARIEKFQSDFQAGINDLKDLVIRSNLETNKCCELAEEMRQSYEKLPGNLRFVFDYTEDQKKTLVKQLHEVEAAVIKEERKGMEVETMAFHLQINLRRSERVMMTNSVDRVKEILIELENSQTRNNRDTILSMKSLLENYTDMSKAVLESNDNSCDTFHKVIERLYQYVDDELREITGHSLLKSDDNDSKIAYAEKKLIEMQKILVDMKFKSYKRTGKSPPPYGVSNLDIPLVSTASHKVLEDKFHQQQKEQDLLSAETPIGNSCTLTSPSTVPYEVEESEMHLQRSTSMPTVHIGKEFKKEDKENISCQKPKNKKSDNKGSSQKSKKVLRVLSGINNGLTLL